MPSVMRFQHANLSSRQEDPATNLQVVARVDFSWLLEDSTYVLAGSLYTIFLPLWKGDILKGGDS
jgi:hypothetical protein